MPRVLASAKCIVTSEYNGSALLSTFQVAATAVIPPLLDFESIPRVGIPEPGTIAYPGRITPGKGALEAVLLVGQLSNSYGPLTLLLSDATQNCYRETKEHFALLEEAASAFPRLKVEFCRPGASLGDHLKSGHV